MGNTGEVEETESLTSKINRKDIAYPLLVTILAFFGATLRCLYLFQPMRYDESFTSMAFAYRPLSVGLSFYPYPNNHLFHTMLVHFSTKLLGNSPAAIRLPAFLAGIALIPVGYLVLKELYDRDTGLLAVALIAASPLLIAYSTNARGFSIQALAFLLLLFVGKKLKDGPKLSLWIWFSLLIVVGFYTVPTMLYFFVAAFVWLAISALVRDVKSSRLGFFVRLCAWSAVALLVSALLYIPVVVKSGLASLTSNQFVKSLGFHGFVHGLPGAIKNWWLAWSAGITPVIGVVLAAAVLISLIFHYRISKDKVPLPAVTLGCCLVLIVIQRVLPDPRVFLPLLPLLLGFAAAGLIFTSRSIASRARARTGRRLAITEGQRIAMVLVLFICLAVIVVIVGMPYQHEDTGQAGRSTFRQANEVALAMREILKPGDVVFLDWPAATPLEYYFTIYGIDHHYIYGNGFGKPQGGAEATRAFLITDTEDKHTLTEAFPSAAKFKLQLIYNSQGAKIYRILGPKAT